MTDEFLHLYAYIAAAIFAGVVLHGLRDIFFTKIYTYTYGFSFTDAKGNKSFSEISTQSPTAPTDQSYFGLAQESVRRNNPRYEYEFAKDPQFQLAYAQYLSSTWRRTATLLKAQEERKRKEKAREDAAADEPTDSDKAA